MLNLRKGYVVCHYTFDPHVACQQVLCYMSNLRDVYVFLSILGVKGHIKGDRQNTNHRKDILTLAIYSQ